MGRLYLGRDASRARLKEAAAARDNRRDIVKALSWGQVSRRELLKYGLITAGGMIAPIRGLSPYATTAYAASTSDVPTGLPPSQLFGVKPFTQPMLRFDVLPRTSIDTLTPAPAEQSNQTLQVCNDLLGGGMGPIEGRPPGAMWAHQGFQRFPPQVAIEVAQDARRSTPPTTRDATRATTPAYPPACRASRTSPEPRASGSAGAVDLQRVDPAEADDRPLRRSDPVPSSQSPAVRHP